MTLTPDRKPKQTGESRASATSVLSRDTDKEASPAENHRIMYTPVSQRIASAYKKVGVESRVETASPHELISLLFEGLLSSLSAAKIHLASGNVAAKSQAITKSMRIISEGLKGSLDPQAGELSQNLGLLYDYCVAQLMQAHLKNDVELIDEVVNLMAPVADTWKNMHNHSAQ